MSVEVINISKTFGKYEALKNIELKVETGELVALLGPSGSGKTTLLRIIAGLESSDMDKGKILFHGNDVTRETARTRQVGFVFQHYALFRHMTVFENIAFGLEVKPRKQRPSKEKIRERVLELLALMKLDNLGNRLPTQLSGGQRQRVALARALAVDPKVLLLDEPFGALDARVRKDLRRWIRNLHEEIHVTSIFVTHDQEEAMEVADRVVIMSNGKIEQVGSPQEVYENPATEFVFNFLGNINQLKGKVKDGKAQIGPMELDAPHHPAPTEAETVAYVRPFELEIERCAGTGERLPVRIRHIFAFGSLVKLEMERVDTGDLVEAEVTREKFQSLEVQIGDEVFVRPKTHRVFVPDYAI